MFLDSYEKKIFRPRYLRLRKEKVENKNKTRFVWWTHNKFFWKILRIETWLKKMKSEDCLELNKKNLII